MVSEEITEHRSYKTLLRLPGNDSKISLGQKLKLTHVTNHRALSVDLAEDQQGLIKRPSEQLFFFFFFFFWLHPQHMEIPGSETEPKPLQPPEPLR